MRIFRVVAAVDGLVLVVLWLGGRIGSVTGAISWTVHALPVVAALTAAVVTVAALAMWSADQRSFTAQARIHGWEHAITAWQLPQVGPAIPDPGNPGHLIRLYEAPAGLLHPSERIGILLALNGTPNPATGRPDVVAVFVQAGHPDALTAAATAAGVPAHIYAAISTRT